MQARKRRPCTRSNVGQSEPVGTEKHVRGRQNASASTLWSPQFSWYESFRVHSGLKY